MIIYICNGTAKDWICMTYSALILCVNRENDGSMPLDLIKSVCPSCILFMSFEKLRLPHMITINFYAQSYR